MTHHALLLPQPQARRFQQNPRPLITNERFWPVIAFHYCNLLGRRPSASRRKRP